MGTDSKHKIQAWHTAVYTKDAAILSNFLAEEVEFHSPVFWKPKLGKKIASVILTTVIDVFEDFKYEREWLDERRWALEFSARIGDKALKGIDLIEFDAAGKIAKFEVMVRPLNALQALGEEMGKRLAATGAI